MNIDKNILLSGLNKAINCLDENSEYHSKLLEWKKNLLYLNEDSTNNIFLQNCIMECVKKGNIIREDSLDEEIIVSPDKSKSWEDEPPEDVKKDKTDEKKILENKKFQESLNNDSIVGYFILESVINQEDIYLLNRYLLQEENLISTVIGGAYNLFSTVVNGITKFINSGSRNIRDISDRFTSIDKMIENKLEGDKQTAKYIEDTLKQKIEQLPPDKKDIFTTNLILLNNSESSVKNGAVDYIINNSKDDKWINLRKNIWNNNDKTFLTGAPKYLETGELRDIKIRGFDGDIDTITLNTREVDIYNEFLKITTSYNSNTWGKKGLTDGLGVYNMMDKEMKISKNEFEAFLNKLNLSGESLNKENAMEAIDNYVDTLSSSGSELIKHKDVLQQIDPTDTLSKKIYNTADTIDVSEKVILFTTIGVSISLLIIIVATLIHKQFKKINYIKKNCRPGDKDCMLNAQMAEMDNTIKALEEIRKKSKLNSDQKVRLEKKLSKLIQLRSKMEGKKELLKKKNEYIKIIALYDAKNKI